MNIMLIAAGAVGLSTALGAALGFLLKKIPHKYNDVILGAAAGIMLAAAVLGLIQPATQCSGRFTLPMVVFGVLCGAWVISVLDAVTPHLHHLAGIDSEKHSFNAGVGKVLLFVSAIAIHKFPEGLAAGVSFGTENLGDVVTVAGSISIQNVPEAMVIIAPLLAVGVSHARAFAISLAIGAIGVIGTVLGYVLVSYTVMLLPFMLSFAGGTMLYVVSDEMIPETHSHGFEKQSTFALISGFLLILVFQQIFVS